MRKVINKKTPILDLYNRLEKDGCLSSVGLCNTIAREISPKCSYDFTRLLHPERFSGDGQSIYGGFWGFGDNQAIVKAQMNDVMYKFTTLRKNLLLLLRRSDCRGAVAEHQKRVLGFLIYRFLVHRFYIVNFATRLDFRRLGVASGMIKYLKSGISLTHTRIAVDVRETNLSAQFFLAKNGFRAVHVNEGYFQDTKESSYRMYFP